MTNTFFPAPSSLFYNLKTIARFRGETEPNQTTAWYGGDLTGGASGASGTAEDYANSAMNPARPPLPMGFRGRVTPGQPNLMRDSSSDSDHDGLTNLMEQAIHSDPLSASSSGPLPAPLIITEAGQSYLNLYPHRRPGCRHANHPCQRRPRHALA